VFGLIGKLIAAPGKRDEVMALVAAATSAMPGCVSYGVAADSSESDTIWVTEIWETEDDHQRSLQLPDVRAAIEQAMPHLVGGETIATTVPFRT
jgi:quinol monooxygenase YgiN